MNIVNAVDKIYMILLPIQGMSHSFTKKRKKKKKGGGGVCS